MYARIRNLWAKVNSSYWFYPALLTALSTVLAAGSLIGDAFADEWLTWIMGPALRVSADGARAALNVMASSLIGVAATVFSITIAAVVYASGTYGPRILTNFMENRGNQLSLAVLIGAFVHAVIILCAVRNQGGDGSGAAWDFVPHGSLVLACAWMALSVGVLVFLLNHIPSSIRIHSVLEGIGQRLLADIDRRYPRSGTTHRDTGEEAEGEEVCCPHAGYIDFIGQRLLADIDRRYPRSGTTHRDTGEEAEGEEVCCPHAGYIDFIDFAALRHIAVKAEGKLVLTVQPGDFVVQGRALLRCVGFSPDDGDRRRDLLRSFSFSGSRTPAQDLTFLIDELTEVALRALSPGINDPYTAITCIHWLCASTVSLATRPLQQPWHVGEEHADRIRMPQPSFEDFLERGLAVVRDAAARNPLAAREFLENVTASVEQLRGSLNAVAIFRQCDLLAEQARLALDGPALEEVEQTYAACRAQIVK